MEEDTVARVRAEQLYGVASTLARAQSKADVGRIFSREITALLGADTAWVGTIDSDGRSIYSLGSEGYSEHAEKLWRRMDWHSGAMLVDVLRSGDGQFWESSAAMTAAYPSRANAIADSLQESLVMLPLIDDSEQSRLIESPAAQQVIGGIAIGFHTPRQFDEDTRAFYRALAQQCALAIVRARAYEAERIARSEAEAARARAEQLQSLTAALARATSSSDVVDAAVVQGGRILGSTSGSIALLVEDGRAFTLIGGPGMPEEIAAQWFRFPNEGPSPAVQAVTTRQPCYSQTRADFVRSPGLERVAAQLNINANAALPLIVAPDSAQSKVLGIIAFTFDEPRVFSTEDDRFLRTIAAQCAQALERLHLFAAEQQAREDAELARASAEGANLAKSQFLATMSHELRTPLNAIGGYTELMELGAYGPVSEEQRGALVRIKRSQEHLLALINEVLSYARVEASAVQYDIMPVEVRSALLHAEASVLPQLRKKGLPLEIIAGPDHLSVMADADKLNQILINLLSNALKFTPPGGRIKLEPARIGEVVSIVVEDTGLGIPPAQLERIFEPFVQVGRTLTSMHEGTGLGLAISRELARGMGGEIRVSSVLERGSRFELTLPAG